MASKYFDITGLLSTDGYVMCNKELIRLYGTDCAVLIGELCAEYKYYATRDELSDGMFYSTQENIEVNTGLSPHCQREAIKVLKDAGIISVEKRGMPAKNYFLIHEAQLCKIFTTSPSKNERQVVQNSHLNNNKKENKEKPLYNTEPEFEGHSYSPEELQSEFLGSVKKRQKTRGKSLYDKCVDEVTLYTKDVNLHALLVQYLLVRLDVKDKPLLGVNQWKGILNKLTELTQNSNVAPADIVKQSIEKGWCSFYPLHTSQNSSVFSEGEGVYCESSTDTEEERKSTLRKQGRRSSF